MFDFKQNKFIEPKPDYYISQTTGHDCLDNYYNNKIQKLKVY